MRSNFQKRNKSELNGPLSEEKATFLKFPEATCNPGHVEQCRLREKHAEDVKDSLVRTSTERP